MTINDACHQTAVDLKKKLMQNRLRADVDSRSETLKKKVRDAQLKKIPVILTIGEKEMANDTVSIRTLDGTVVHDVAVDDFISQCRNFDSNRDLTISFK